MVRFAAMASLASGKMSSAVSSSIGPPSPEYADWQAAMADAVTDPAELCDLLGLDAPESSHGFRLLVSRAYLSRIRPGDPRDPLLVQVLPTDAEGTTVPGFEADPLGETRLSQHPGLLQKYEGRSLIVAAAACSVHCRFCFRRHFPFGSDSRQGADWDAAIRQIAADESTGEVILSGGDPLTIPDGPLERWIGRLSEIPHVRRVRIHTRLPVMIPQRVTGALLSLLRATRLAPIVVVHVNHPREIDGPVAAAFGRLVDAGVPLLQQGVLLRGVNDRADVLAELYERLSDLRVMPYYLHQLDRVAGAAHFEVSPAVGIELIEQLRARLPGYAIPRYVRETPEGASKQVLA